MPLLCLRADLEAVVLLPKRKNPRKRMATKKRRNLLMHSVVLSLLRSPTYVGKMSLVLKQLKKDSKKQ